jgi:hypothetical protein
MARKKITRTVPSANARHFWLAGLGLVSMAGRATATTAAQAVDNVAQARRQAKAMVEQTQSRLVEGAGELRHRVEIGVAQACLKLDEALSPLVAKFVPGKAKRPARRGRKPAAKKAARRPARKPVATRRARKG